MKRAVHLITLTIFLVLFSASALALLPATPSDWSQFGQEASNVHVKPFTLYNEYAFGDVIVSERGEGTRAFQPLIIDFTGDGIPEILTHDGNFLKVYRATNKNIVLFDELLLGEVQAAQGFSADFNEDGTIEYVMATNTFMYTIQHNGTDFNTLASANLSALGFTPQTGVHCERHDSFGSKCWVGMSDGRLLEYRPLTGNTTLIDYSGQSVEFAPSHTTHRGRYSPASFDITNNGIPELGITTEKGFLVVSLSDYSFVIHESDVTTGSAAFNRPKAVFMGNIDNVGTGEVCLTWSEGGTEFSLGVNRVRLGCWNSDGSEFGIVGWQNTQSNEGWGVSNVIFVDVDYKKPDGTFWENFFDIQQFSQRELCFVASSDSSALTQTRYRCYDPTDGTLQHKYSLDLDSANTGVHGTTNVNALTAAHLLGEAPETPALLVGMNVVQYNPTTDALELVATLGSGDRSMLAVIADATGDGFMDIIRQREDGIQGIFSSLTNDPPQLRQDMAFSGYGGTPDYTNPICKGTVVQFSAREFSSGSPNIPWNYENDVSTDEERILTNCGFSPLSENLTAGTFALSQPTFSCFYNQTGTYNVRLYLEDNANIGDRSQYNQETIQVNVIDGTSGVDCNLGTLATGSQPVTPEAESIDKTISQTFDILLGTSPLMKFIISIAAVIGMVITTAQYTSSPIPIGVVAGLGLGLFSLLGMLPLWVMILLVVSSIIIIALAVTIRPAGGGV